MPEEVAATRSEPSDTSRPPVKTSPEADGRVERIVQETRRLTDDLTEWVNLRIRLVQFDLQERIDQELDFVFSSVMVIGMITIALFMASFGAAYVIGDLLGTQWYGFAIIAVVYLVAALVISRIRPRVAAGFRSEWVKARLEQASKPTDEEQ